MKHVGVSTRCFLRGVCLGFFLLPSVGLAQPVSLVSDLRTAPNPYYVSPSNNMTAVGSRVFFVAASPGAGNELWVSDGTTAGTRLVKDIRPGAESSSPNGLTNVGGTVFFQADDGTNGAELWKSDGTEAGTVLVKDAEVGPGGSFPNYLVTNGSVLFYSYGGPAQELWRSDGTEAGTYELTDIPPEWHNSQPRNLAWVGGALYFGASDPYVGPELWRSDGTEAGTVLVKDVRPGTPGSGVRSITEAGGIVFFVANDGVNGEELWRTDGTAAGTTLVSDVNPGSPGSSPQSLTNVGGTLFFVANDGTNGSELWKSDGTPGGTALVKDICAGCPPNVSNLVTMGGALYFTASDGTTGRELWRSDGTGAGTVRVTDLCAGGMDGVIGSLAVHASRVYFQAGGCAASGNELWASDGTTAGTAQVKDVCPGGCSSGPGPIVAAATSLFFGANDGTNGPQLWKSDGSDAGTVPVTNATVLSSFPNVFVDLAGTLVFAAAAPTANTRTLWKSDGTAAGTAQLAVGRLYNPRAPVLFGGRALFPGDAGGGDLELWASDGTEAGTVLVKDVWPGGSGSNPTLFTPAGGMLFFVANDGTNGSELWKSDGTGAGTVLVKDVRSGSSGSNVQNMVAVGSRVFFTADDGVNGRELWVSDGTEAGTTLVEDLFPGSGGSNSQYLVEMGGALYFTASDGSGNWLFRSDGTAAGTSEVTKSTCTNPMYQTKVGGALFFTGWTSTGWELCTSDGTSAGTRMVRKIFPAGSSSPSGFVAVGSTAFFRANDGATGTELWRSDGTEAGTWRLADIRPGNGSSLPRAITPVGGAVYFVANDGDHGEELWKTAGSNEGTFFVQDLNPGAAHSEAGFLVPFGGRLVFSGDDGTIGLEPRIVGQAGLSVTKSASSPAPTQGSTLTWTITVANAGPLPATGMRVIDPLPPGVTFVSSSPGSPTCNVTAGTLVCLLGTLASGANAVVTVTATVNVGFTGALSNTARVIALEVDPAGGDDFATVSVTVPGPTAPTGLFAQPASPTSVALTWNDPSSTQTGIRIDRSTDGATFLPVTTVGAHVVSHVDPGLAPGTLYHYRVVAVQAGVGESAPSNVAAAQTRSDVATKVCPAQIGPDHRWSRNPAVAWNGATWALAMQVRSPGKELDEIRFQRLDAATGLPTGTPVNLSDDDMNSSYPTIRWNGSRHAVLWYSGMRTAAGAQASSVAMALLDGTGALLRVSPRIADGAAYINDNLETALAWNGTEWGLVLPMLVGTQSDLYFTRISAAGDVVGAPVRLTETPEIEIDASLAWSGSAWGVSWVRRTPSRGVWFQRLQADGSPLGTPNLVYENAAGTNVMTTSAVWDGTGWAVAWDDVGPGPNNPEWLTLARLNVDGSPNGAPVRVSPEYDPDFPPEEQKPNYDSLPQLFAKPGGGYVAFTSATFNTTFFNEIARYEMDASGNRIGARTILSANDDHYSVYSRAAFDGSKYLVAYNDGATNHQEVARFVAAASGPAIQGPALLTSGGGPGDTWGVGASANPVALATGRGFTLVWTELALGTGLQLHATVLDALGNVTANRWPLSTREARTRPGAVSTGGAFALAWKAPGDDVWFDRYDASGASLLGEVLVAPMQYGRPAVGVAYSGEVYGVAWVAGATLGFQRVSPSGALLGGRTTLTLASTPTTTPLQVAWTGSGWAIVYTRGTRLEYVFLDPTGAVDVGPVAIGSTSTTKGAFSAVWSGLRLGVAWVESTGSPSLQNDVLFTAVAPNGVPDFAPVAVVSSAWNDGNPSLYWAGDRFNLVHSFGEYPVLREVGVFPDGSFASAPRLLNPRGGTNAVAWNGATLGVAWPQQSDLYFATTECLADATPPSCPSVTAVRTGQAMTITLTPGSDAESGVFRSYLYRDGVLLAELFPATTSVLDGGLLPGAAPTYEPRSMNGAWLESAGCASVKPSTDLSAAITDAPDPVTQVQNLAYTATATNAGLSPATAVILTVTIPPQATFQSATPGAPSCVHAAGTVTCALGTLAPGASSVVSVVVRPKAGAAGAIAAAAGVNAAEGDPNGTNDSASTTTTVLAPAPARNLFVTARTTTTVSLKWTDPQGGETAFRLERSTDGSSFTAIDNLGPDVTTYVDGSRSPATLYFYRVVAVQNLVGEAPPSNVASATTLAATAARVCATPLGPFAANASGPMLAWTGTSWATAWTERRDGLAEEVWFQRLDSTTLAPIGSAVRVSQTGAPSSARALRWNGSKLGLLWQESMKRPDGTNVYDYRFTAFDAAGNRLQGDVPAFRLEARATHGPAEVPLLWNGAGWGAFVLENPAYPNDIRYFRLDADGRPIGSPVAVTASAEWELSLSVAWSGTEYGIAFTRTGFNGGAYQVLLQRMAIDGTLVGAPAVVWENAALGEGDFLAGTTSVAWDGASWVLAFTDIGPDPDQAEAVWLRRVSAAGAPSGAAVRLSPAFDPDLPPEDQYPVFDQTPSVLPKAGGGFVVLTSSWLNTTRYREICRYEANASLARVGTRIVVSTGDSRNSTPVRAATDATRVLVAWNEGRSGTPEVATTLLDAAGGTLVAPTEITGGHTLGYSGNPVALALGSGFGALYTYQDASLSQTSIGGAFWNGSGSLVATRTPLSARGTRAAPGAVAAGSSFAIAWKDFANDVVFARYDATGAPIGLESVVATGAGGRPYVGLAFGGDSYGLAYWVGANLYLHRVAPDGTTLGTRALVTTTMENGAPGPQIQWVGSGWAIVWLQGTHLFYARLDASGVIVVPPIQVTFTPQVEAAYQLTFTGQHLGLAWHEYAVPDPPGGEVFFTVLGLDGIKAFAPVAIGSSDLDDYYPSIYWDVDRFRVVMVPSNPGVLRELAILPGGTVLPEERMLWNAGGLNSVAWNGATLGLAWLTGGYVHFQTTACLADVSPPPCPAATAAFDGEKTTVAWAPVADADSGLWRYDVYRDGLLVAEERPTTTSWVDTAPPPGVAHAYGVRALNRALLESAGCATTSPAADLGVTVADSPDPVPPGGSVTYTLTVSNAGPSAASDVTLVDTLPAGVTFTSSNPSSPTCAHAAGVVTCALGTIASGASRVVTISVALAAGTTGVLANTAAVSAVETDPVAANDTATATTTSCPSAPVVGSSSPVCAGGTISLTVTSTAGATYAWTGPGGFTSALQNPTIPNATTAMSGTYSVTITGNSCVSAPLSTNVVVNALPATPVATSNGPVNAGATINLFASTVAGATYSWTGPNGFTSTLQNPTIPNAAAHHAGTYSVTATTNGCASLPGTTNVDVDLSGTLTVLKLGTGLGTVVSSPPGITCGAACSAEFAAGTVVTLTAAASPGSRFAGWAGGGCMGTGSCTVTVAGSTTVSATFLPTTAAHIYTVTPCRAVDTRDPAGPLGGPALAAGTTREFVLGGTCGVPSDAVAVSLNVTVADATRAGTLTMYPGTGPAPGTNTITFVVGKNRANNVTMGLIGGSLSVADFQATGTVQLIVDVNGYYR